MATCGCIYHQMCLEKYLMNRRGGEDQNSSKTTDKASSFKETSDQATSSIVDVSTTPANSKNVMTRFQRNSSDQIQHPKFRSSSGMMPEVSNLIKWSMNDAQKKPSRKSGASTEKSSKLLTDVALEAPVPCESLEEARETVTSIFLQLTDKIDSAESKNKDASRGLIYGYFDFGEAIFNRYKKLKPDHGKDGSQVLVKSEVREAIPEAKCSDEKLYGKRWRDLERFISFNGIDKEKIVQIKSISLGFILNLTKDRKDYAIAEVLKQKV
ncbi:hypothetical protein C1646_670764 [Rhizophagus diaphanus]|nr:hypothetical protein C1646_670764 [Rhizophagus diaphanus] [Rhizophagus sp. MUCL 43196]